MSKQLQRWLLTDIQLHSEEKGKLTRTKDDQKKVKLQEKLKTFQNGASRKGGRLSGIKLQYRQTMTLLYQLTLTLPHCHPPSTLNNLQKVVSN